MSQEQHPDRAHGNSPAVSVGELLAKAVSDTDAETTRPLPHGPLVAQFGLTLGGRSFAVVIHDCGEVAAW
jgi:hypothetical protein